MVELLVEKGANVNAVDRNNYTALSFAAEGGETPFIFNYTFKLNNCYSFLANED